MWGKKRVFRKLTDVSGIGIIRRYSTKGSDRVRQEVFS